MKQQYLLYLLTGLTLFSSCSKDEENRNKIDFDIASHRDQLEEFQKTELERYSYTYYSSGFYLDHFRVFVSNGKVDSLIDLLEESQSNSRSFANIQNYHIDTIFSDITGTFERNNGISTAGKDYYITGISCSYDSKWHFPTSYSYGYYSSPYIAVDGNWGAEIFDFIPEE